MFPHIWAYAGGRDSQLTWRIPVLSHFGSPINFLTVVCPMPLRPFFLRGSAQEAGVTACPTATVLSLVSTGHFRNVYEALCRR